jgi:hypothetical protein
MRSVRSWWRRLVIRSQSRHSARTVRTKRSAIAFAFGARAGVLMMRMPSLVKTASKSRVNLRSRSRIRKRNRSGCSWSDQTNWRACHPEREPAQLPGRHQPRPLTPRTPSLTQRAPGAERADVSDDNRGILMARRRPRTRFGVAGNARQRRSHRFVAMRLSTSSEACSSGVHVPRSHSRSRTRRKPRRALSPRSIHGALRLL